MKASIKSILGPMAAGLAFGLVALSAGAALAGGGGGGSGGGSGPGCGCGTGGGPPPPPPPPPSCCQPPRPPVYVPGVTVDVSASVVVNANVSAQASAYGSGSGSASGSGSGQSYVYYGGGGGGGYVGPGVNGFVQGLNVDGGFGRGGYEASRTKLTKVVIQAVCIDDKDVPHPASQVTPDRDIDDAYEGEVYRCIAGTHMQYVWAAYDGHIAFDHGQTVDCAKAQALWHSPGGKLECRAQKPARDCNERSLLRRFGAGVKILTMITVERYSEYHEEKTQAVSGAFNLDGGVGGMVY